jgi:hypothetical protein
VAALDAPQPTAIEMGSIPKPEATPTPMAPPPKVVRRKPQPQKGSWFTLKSLDLEKSRGLFGGKE